MPWLRLFTIALISALVLVASGCISTPQQALEAYGKPDAILDESGDYGRLHRPGERPAHGWPGARTTRWYYLEANRAFTIRDGQVIRRSKIDPERRKLISEMTEDRDRRRDEL